MESPENKLYFFESELHTAEGIIAVAKEIQIAHPDIANILNFDALLDHFWEVQSPVFEIQDNRVYAGVTISGSPIYKYVVLVDEEEMLRIKNQ